jgi:hypothetical protein
MKIYTKIVMDMTSDNLDVIESSFEENEGDIALCGGGSSGGGYKMSSEEKALYKQLTENMQYFQGLYKNNQQSYDLQILEGNKQLYPQLYEYSEAQLNDARSDLTQNREIKDAMAQKQLKDIGQQSQLADKQFADANERIDRYDQVESQLVNERLGMLSADVNGAMGKATADVAQSYATQRDALAREQGRLGITPGSGLASESSRLTGLDAAKTNALARQTARDAETTRVENANVQRAAANWSKDANVLNSGRSTMLKATDYSAMLNGGYGVYNPYTANLPSGTDFAAASANATQSASAAPTGTYVQGRSSGGIGGAISGGLGGAAAGAMVGSVVPGIGTAAGAIGGGLIGAVGGMF